MTKRAPDQSDPGWFKHSYLLETTHRRCNTCGETHTENRVWLVKAHMSYTPLTSLTHRHAVPPDACLDSRLPAYQVEQDAETPLCHLCFDESAQSSRGFNGGLIKSTPQGWRDAIELDAKRRRAKATIGKATETKAEEQHKKAIDLLASI